MYHHSELDPNPRKFKISPEKRNLNANNNNFEAYMT